MKVLIVDDEPFALLRLERLLREASVEEVLTAQNAYEAKKILEENPDIEAVFLDIRMPGKDGVQLAREIVGERDDVFIVFQTAYEEHSLQAFEVGAIGYLTKPYFLEDVIRVLNRIKKFRGEKPRIQVLDRSENLIPMPLSDIYYFEAKLKHSLCVTRRGAFICPKSIGYLEEALKSYGFLRVHKSYLVNLDKVASFRSLPNGKIEVCFKDLPRKIITSKLGAKKLREVLKI